MALYKLIKVLIHAFLDGINFLLKTLLNEDPRDINVVANPGLITLLDVALFRANEGELTATICSSNDLLNLFYEIKEKAVLLLRTTQDLDSSGIVADSGCRNSNSGSSGVYPFDIVIDFAKTTICCCNGAIESIVKDGLSSSANIAHEDINESTTDKSESRHGSQQNLSTLPLSPASHHSRSGENVTSLVVGTLAPSKHRDFANSTKPIKLETSKDDWESPYMICPDAVWASQALISCSRASKIMRKHHFITSVLGSVSTDCINHGKMPEYCSRAAQLSNIILHSLPGCIDIFKVAIESNLVVSRRLYLVKCEYRAPFRAFLEIHEKFHAAPSMETVQQYLKLHNGPSQNRVYHVPRDLKARRTQLEESIDGLMQNSSFLRSLELERQCEQLEHDMATMLLPFAALACLINGKRLEINPNQLRQMSPAKKASLQTWLREFEALLTGDKIDNSKMQKLLAYFQYDLDDNPHFDLDDESVDGRGNRLQDCLSVITSLVEMAKMDNGSFLVADKKESEMLMGFLKTLEEVFDAPLFEAQFEDWFRYVKSQNEITSTKEYRQLAMTMKETEKEYGIAMASKSNLEMLKMRLGLMERDRQSRFELLQEIIHDISLRELGSNLTLQPPSPDVPAVMPPSMIFGIFAGKAAYEERLLNQIDR